LAQLFKLTPLKLHGGVISNTCETVVAACSVPYCQSLANKSEFTTRVYACPTAQATWDLCCLTLRSTGEKLQNEYKSEYIETGPELEATLHNAMILVALFHQLLQRQFLHWKINQICECMKIRQVNQTSIFWKNELKFWRVLKKSTVELFIEFKRINAAWLLFHTPL